MLGRKKILSAFLLLLAFNSHVNAESPNGTEVRVIDVHGHAYAPGAVFGGPREQELALTEGTNILNAAAEIMQDYHVEKYLASGAMAEVDRWFAAMPNIVVRGVLFPCPAGFVPGTQAKCFADGSVWPDVDWLRNRLRSGTVGFLGEVTTVYAGVSLNDPRLDAYYALAVEFGVPILVHTGAGPPNKPPMCQCPNYDLSMGNPSALRPVLTRYPDIQVLLMHAGGPGFLDETLALMEEYENVYADLGAITLAWKLEEVNQWVRAFQDRRLGDRLLFGSDAVFSLPATVAVINKLGALNAKQRRDILYDNGVKFLHSDR